MSSYRFVSRRARPGIWRSAALLLLFIALNGTWVSDVAADSAQEHPNPAPPAEAAPPAEPEHQPVAAATEEVASTDEAGTPAAVEDPAPAEEQAHAGGGDDARVAESEHAAAESADSSASEQPAPPADVPEPPVETEQAPEVPVESERNPEVDSGVTEEEGSAEAVPPPSEAKPAAAHPAAEEGAPEGTGFRVQDAQPAQPEGEPAAAPVEGAAAEKVAEDSKAPTREELATQRDEAEAPQEESKAPPQAATPAAEKQAKQDSAAPTLGGTLKAEEGESSVPPVERPGEAAGAAAGQAKGKGWKASWGEAEGAAGSKAEGSGGGGAKAEGTASAGAGSGSGEKRTGADTQAAAAAAARRRAQDEKVEKTLITDMSASGGGAKGRGQAKEEEKPETPEQRRVRELVEEGMRCLSGINNTKIDLNKAMDSFTQASALGSLRAKSYMGEMYKHGKGVDVDIDKARELFTIAAAGGDAAAQRNLAFLYASGIGMEEDRMRAILYYHFAATGNDHLAQLAMGYRHMYGVDVPKNCQAAVEYYLPAAEAVVREIQQFRPPPMMERHTLASEGSKPRPSDQDEDVVDYYQYSAARGDASAQVALGQLHYFGARGLEQDYGEALRWYEKAGEQGDGNALGHMGNMYVQGIHVKASNETALRLFKKGVEKGNPVAINGLGYMHMYGMGVDQSFSEAMKLFSQAAEQGNQEARFNLGAMYITGLGVTKDYAKAIYYFTLAANRGHMLALYNLAMMHLNGFGTPRSCNNALQFIKSVAERGSWGLRLQDAYKLYRAGEVDYALLLYSEAAELGYEVAQGNVAHIYDEGGSKMTTDSKRKALAAYEISAQQGAVGADLKIGDFYYYGMGTEVNYRKAVTHYRAASEARNAQAMFNLAYMHEHGIGLPQDLHLAKRFYDMAAETSQDAVWPVALCRTKLLLSMAVTEFVEYVDQVSLRLSTQYGPKYGIWLPPSTVWLPWLEQQWDLILIAILVCQLSFVLLLRSHMSAARLAQPARR